MKKIILFCLFSISLNFAFAQTNFGYDENPPAAFDLLSSTNFYPIDNITLPSETEITHIGINTNTSTNFVAGIYGFSTGSIALVANTNLAGTLTSTGPNSIPLVTHITLPAGNYIIGVQGQADYMLGNDGTTTNIQGSIPNTFGTLPSSIGAFLGSLGAPIYSVYAIGNPVIATTVAVAPIPTMSQWGLLIFGLLIMNLSIFFVMRRSLI